MKYKWIVLLKSNKNSKQQCEAKIIIMKKIQTCKQRIIIINDMIWMKWIQMN